MIAATMVMMHPIPIPARRPSQSAYNITVSILFASLLCLFWTYQRTTDEETTDDGTDCVACVDQTDSVTILLKIEVEPVEPVFGSLKSLMSSS